MTLSASLPHILYFRDLAAAIDRMQEYSFDEMIYVVRQLQI